jgi:hypothetical protein
VSIAASFMAEAISEAQRQKIAVNLTQQIRRRLLENAWLARSHLDLLTIQTNLCSRQPNSTWADLQFR